MQYKNTTLAILLATMTATAGIACSSTPEADDDAIPVELPRADAAEAFHASAPWLPAGSDVVISIAGPTIWDFLGYGLLPTTNPDAAPGELGTIDGLRSDFGDILRQYFGFDFGETYSLVTAMDIESERLSVVILGEFDAPPTATTVDVGDHTAYEIDLGEALSEVFTYGEVLYALPIDEPRRGLVFAQHTEELMQLVDDAGLSDPGGEAHSTFPRLFDDAHGAAVAVAVTAEHMEPMLADFAAMGMPVPSAAIVSYGEAFRTTIEGEPHHLQQITALVEDYVEYFRADVEADYDADDDNYLTRLATIFLHHTMAAVSDQLYPELDDNRLRYEIELTDQGSRTDVLLASLLPYGIYAMSAALDDYTTRAVTSEAVAVLSSVSRAALIYCEGDQQYSAPDGAEPWHPGDPGEAGSRPGMPVSFDKKTFPGGPNIKITTAPEIPEGGETITADPQFEGDVEFDIKPVLQALNFDPHQAQSFRYTYETGPGTGPEATARIIAEANFDPDSPHHQMTVLNLSIDEHYGCVADPAYTMNEGH